ncbi:MAG: SulP family inorganic anion transporter [Oceanospirillaceae bacterium]|nr:SulP family inorganic anion transporter [Oceanospirillaceae bacterium]
MKYRIFPFLVWFKYLTLNDIKADFIAGLTGAVIVLPQGIAFATIAGLPPQYGLYTAMVTPIVAALFGSSKHLISGPTTAISIVVFTSISGYAEPGSEQFIAMTLTLTLMAGVYQLGFGLAGLGKLVDFVSHTVVIGFTAGAAILIATSQVQHLTAIATAKGLSFYQSWIATISHLEQLNPSVLSVGIATLLVAILVKKYQPTLPNLLIAMLVGSLLALSMGSDVGITLVGAIPAGLPPLSVPDMSLQTLQKLVPQAFAIALLGLIEAVAIGRAIANKSQQRIYPNQEFIGQGLSNIVGSFFSCYAGSGSFTRSGVNYAAGAKSGLSAIFAALLLIFIVLLIAPLTAYLPVAAMAGVILIVAYNLVDFSHIKKILSTSKAESSVLLITFVSTLFLALEFAIYLGVLMSLILFLAKTSSPEITLMSLDIKGLRFVEGADHLGYTCPPVRVLRVDMSIYFGSVNHIQNEIECILNCRDVSCLLILCEGINFIDLSGTELLLSLDKKLKARGGGLYFFAMKPLVKQRAIKLGLTASISPRQFYDSRQKVINDIYPLLQLSVCERCEQQLLKTG